MRVDDGLIDDDRRARQEALDVSRSFIVQAPAGSGKTELLIQRYLRLLAVVDHPEEVLAITFTRKAAAEMSIRVVQALQRARDRVVPEQPHERVTADAAGDVLARDERLEWHILDNPRRLRIQTLDALNATVSRSRPLTSARGTAGSTIAVDAEMRTLYRTAAALTFDQLPEPDEFQSATETVLKHVDNHTGLYIEYLARMLSTRDQWLPFIGSGRLSEADSRALRHHTERSLETVVASHIEQTRGEIPEATLNDLRRLGAYAAANLHTDNPDHAVCALVGEAALTECGVESIGDWRALAELLLTAGGAWRKQLNKNLGFPPSDDGQKAELAGILEELQHHAPLRESLCGIRNLPPVSYSDEQWQVLLALFRLLPVTVTELQRLFIDRGVSDHIEVALGAADALGTAEAPGDITLLLDYQLQHILVDEMQDTSSAQYRMLEALTGGWQDGDGRTLFCVGDPMQSIYRFRNAEVGQFLLARRTGIGSVELEPLTLRRNFRSGAKLVDWFNLVFPDVLAPFDDPQRSAVSYAEAVSVPSHEGRGRLAVHPIVGPDSDLEAEEAGRIIEELLRDNPDDDVAVLVRSRTRLPGLLSRLRRQNVDYHAVEIDRLTDLPEIIDILALTRALVHQGDRLAWLAILRAPWLGLDWADLHELVRNDADSTLWERLHDARVRARLSSHARDNLPVFIERLGRFVRGSLSESLRDRVEKAWLTLGGPAVLVAPHEVNNIYRYLDVIEKLEVAGTLHDVAELEMALDAEHVSNDKSSRLQVMTMHRAKGLQFDHVMLYGIGHVPRQPDRDVLSWIEFPGSRGDTQMIISPVGPRAELEKDPVHRYISSVNDEKNRNELGRLLYVACTRARKSLHLLGHARELKDGVAPANGSLLQLLWPIIGREFVRATDDTAGEADSQGGDGSVLPVLRRLSRPWSPAIPTPLPRRDRPATPEAPVDFHWVGAEARVAGTAVHRWIQLASSGAVDLDSDELGQLDPGTRRWLLELGISESRIESVAGRVKGALRGMLEDKRGRWLLQGDGYTELALSGVVDGSVESVVIDRVRIDSDDTHWVVDYKTSSHEGGNLSGFLESEVERYGAQLAKYAELYRNFSNAKVRCALYFPLLQQFVEVDTGASPGR